MARKCLRDPPLSPLLSRIADATADPASGTVFASTMTQADGYTVSIYTWYAVTGALERVGTLQDAGSRTRHRPLAYIPASRACPAAHLVVGACNDPTLDIFELPSLRHVCAAAAPLGPSARIYGLAGDPSGGALVINDAESGAVRVVAWPLREMAEQASTAAPIATN